MTSDVTIDARFCATGAHTGERHDWQYNGKGRQSYTCWNCAITITKAILKEETDA